MRHPSEAYLGICLSCMGPSLHQGCEKAGSHTKESSSIHHWKQRKDGGNYHTYLGMAPLAFPHKSRECRRLNILLKALTGKIALPVPDHVIVQQQTTRNHQGKHIIPISTSTDIYKYSFWPRTIKDWNAITQAQESSLPSRRLLWLI